MDNPGTTVANGQKHIMKTNKTKRQYRHAKTKEADF